jgi:hypothetical protein
MTQPSQPNDHGIYLPHPISDDAQELPGESAAALVNALRVQNAIPELSNTMADGLARSGWTDRVRALAQELMRNGTCNTMPELMKEVYRRVGVSPDAPYHSQGSVTGSSNGVGQANGSSTPTASQAGATAAVPGQGAIVVSKEWTGGEGGLPDVRLPHGPIDEGMAYVREKIKDVVKFEDET